MSHSEAGSAGSDCNVHATSEDEISHRIIGAAIRVHTALGPGLLESAYEACLVYELQQSGLKVERQVSMPLNYRGVKLDCGYRLDILVEGLVIVELKAAEAITPAHKAQAITYLKLSGRRLCLIINFNARRLNEGGIQRVVLGLNE